MNTSTEHYLLQAEYKAEMLNGITLDCTSVPSEVASDCI